MKKLKEIGQWPRTLLDLSELASSEVHCHSHGILEGEAYPLDVSPLNVPQYKYWDKAFILTSKEDMQRKDMSGLSRLTTDEKLREAFSAFGQLLEAKVVVDRASGRSKGFAFVTYASIEDAEQARKDMNAKFLDGWVIFVDPAKPREPRPPPQPESQPSETGFRVNKTIGWCG
ncbi:hypothetical protein CsSME_00038573 [Camellia sinensis var. sinensis]